MIKKIILPLTYESYNNDSTFNLLAYYKNVLNFSGDVVIAVKKEIEDINLTHTFATDTCFFNDSLYEPCCKYFAESYGNEDDYYAVCSNNIIIQNFFLESKFDIYAKYETGIVGFNFTNKIDPNIFIAKKKVWNELNSYYEMLKNNFSIFRKLNKKILFEKMLSSVDYKFKNINKLEYMKYHIEMDYLNNKILVNYHKPNYLYFEKHFSKYKEINDILFEKNRSLIYSWKQICGKFT